LSVLGKAPSGSLTDLFPLECARQVEHAIEMAFSMRSLQTLEYHASAEAGPTDIEIRCVPSGDHSVLLIVRDIGEQQQARRIQNEFVSIVSHELRTPLTSVQGTLKLCLAGAAGELPPRAANLLGVASNNCDRLIRLINDILDVQKIDADRMPFDRQSLDLRSVVLQTVESLRGFAESYGIEFGLEVGDSAAIVVGDPDRLIQVLTNLVSNAIKHSPADSSVKITLTTRGDWFRLVVSDLGPGIPEEFRSRVFEKFAQADSSDTRRLGGTGLGLSIAKSLVERHDGRIGFECPDGGGTKFFVDLPRADSTEFLADLSSVPRVLVCEDDRVASTRLKRLLEWAGYEVHVAGTAAEAKALIGKHQYHAMTLDLLLPDQHGLSLLRELRDDPATRDLPVVVISVDAAETSELNGRVLGVVNVLRKPVDSEKLVGALRAAVAQAESGLPRILHFQEDETTIARVDELIGAKSKITVARNLGEARKHLENRRVDLVLLDLETAGRTGLEWMSELGKSDIAPVPIIVFSPDELDKAWADASLGQASGHALDSDEIIAAIVSAINADRIHLPEQEGEGASD
ncbi:MAG: response regulator, partial [Myxococcales bacterium]|nr:response regulator [Myxococcales bacterium]